LTGLVLEKRKKYHLIELFHQIKYTNQHKLSNKYFKLFCIRSKLSASILITISYLFKFTIVFIYGSMCYLLFVEYKLFYIKFYHIIWYILLFIAMNRGISLGLALAFMTDVISSYLKYRYRQMNKSLDVMVVEPLSINGKLTSDKLKFIDSCRFEILDSKTHSILNS